MTNLLLAELRLHRTEIIEIAQYHGAISIRVLGGNDERETEAIDFLVELEKHRTVVDVGRMIVDLQQLLNRQVNVIDSTTVHERVRDRVLREAIAF